MSNENNPSEIRFEDVYNPDWDSSLANKTVEQEQDKARKSENEQTQRLKEAVLAKEKEKQAAKEAELRAKQEELRNDPTVPSGTKLTTDDGQPVILVQQVVRDEAYNTPGNVAKRLGRRATSAIAFIVGAVIVSIIASVIVNRMNGQMGGPFDALFRMIFGS